MVIYEYFPQSVEPANGAWSGDTLNILGAICHQIYIKPATSSTTYDLTITDRRSTEVRKYVTVTGTLNDLTQWLARGVHTIALDNSSEDEAFTVKLRFRE